MPNNSHDSPTDNAVLISQYKQAVADGDEMAAEAVRQKITAYEAKREHTAP